MAKEKGLESNIKKMTMPLHKVDLVARASTEWLKELLKRGLLDRLSRRRVASELKRRERNNG